MQQTYMISLAVLLDMPSREANSYGVLKVRDLLDIKRGDEFYPELMESMRRNGMSCPVLIINGVFENGHHRIAAAQDLGWSEILCTADDELGWTEDWPDGQIPESWCWESSD